MQLSGQTRVGWPKLAVQRRIAAGGGLKGEELVAPLYRWSLWRRPLMGGLGKRVLVVGTPRALRDWRGKGKVLGAERGVSYSRKPFEAYSPAIRRHLLRVGVGRLWTHVLRGGHGMVRHGVNVG